MSRSSSDFPDLASAWGWFLFKGLREKLVSEIVFISVLLEWMQGEGGDMGARLLGTALIACGVYPVLFVLQTRIC